ncbi:MAG TPA: hypothetical protein VKT73_13465 [Xanthobacteraceae bacterium]|nr:hypothetical protein [Xanthobacteraceae bacterium]
MMRNFLLYIAAVLLPSAASAQPIADDYFYGVYYSQSGTCFQAYCNFPHPPFDYRPQNRNRTPRAPRHNP